MATLRCASQVVVLHINAKNLERLIVKKNPRSQDMLRDQAFSRYTDIVSYCCNHSLHHLIVVFPLNTGITQLLEEMVFNERWILSFVTCDFFSLFLCLPLLCSKFTIMYSCGKFYAALGSYLSKFGAFSLGFPNYFYFFGNEPSLGDFSISAHTSKFTYKCYIISLYSIHQYVIIYFLVHKN